MCFCDLVALFDITLFGHSITSHCSRIEPRPFPGQGGDSEGSRGYLLDNVLRISAIFFRLVLTL